MRLEAFEVGADGSGPSTVLLHGFMGQGRNLRTLAQTWAEREPGRRFLVPDLAGHGTSPVPAPLADLHSLAADVLETARAAGLPAPFHLVGHSLGGRVSLAASVLAPAAVASVSLLDIAPGAIPVASSESARVLEVLLEAPARADSRKAMREGLVGRGLSGHLSDWLIMNLEPEGTGVRWRFDREALARLHARANSQDVWHAVERAGRQPMRCIRGGRGQYVTDADVARLQAAGVPVTTLPEAGHFVHVDALEELVAWLVAPLP